MVRRRLCRDRCGYSGKAHIISHYNYCPMCGALLEDGETV